MTLDRPVLASRKPTGEVPAPFILLEGEEKSGKTWAAIALSASDKVGRTFFLDLGEGTADEYGAIPDADYEVLVHDGTYASILEQVLAVKAIAEAAKKAGEPPVVLIIDTMGDMWEGLKNWVSSRAREKESNKRKLAQDPAAELDVSRNLWNDAGNRYRRFTNALLTFPGIVIGTARGKQISSTDPNSGQPYRDGRKEYKVEGEKGLAYDATLWVRMTRNGLPQIIGARSVHAGIKPGTDKPYEVPQEIADGNLVEALVFRYLKYEGGAQRDLKNVTGGELTADEREDEQAADAKAARSNPRTRQPQSAAAAADATTVRRDELLAKLREAVPDPAVGRKIGAEWQKDHGHLITETTDLDSLAALVATHEMQAQRPKAVAA